jgi:hypothetical protein
MTSRHLHELIDACRPGHEDVGLPEFRELAREMSQDPKLQRLFERSQQLDAAIQAAFHAVKPPAGLANRLLEAIETASSEEGDAAPAIATAELRVEPAQRRSRRSFAAWVGAASLAAVAAVIAIWFRLPDPMPDSDHDIAELVDRWNADLDETSWQTIANIPSQEFPTWRHLDLRGVARWQWVSKRQSVCYDFQGSDGTVRLFVMNPTGAVELLTAPPNGYPSPNGWHVGAWQAKGRIYYLAVKADDGKHKDLYSHVITSSINPA